MQKYRVIQCHQSGGVRHPNVQQEFIDYMLAKYGERSNAYRVYVLGLPPTADDDTVIPTGNASWHVYTR